MKKNLIIFWFLIIVVIGTFVFNFNRNNWNFWLGFIIGGLSIAILAGVIMECEKPDKKEKECSPLVEIKKKSKFQQLVDKKAKKGREVILEKLKKQ